MTESSSMAALPPARAAALDARHARPAAPDARPGQQNARWLLLAVVLDHLRALPGPDRAAYARAAAALVGGDRASGEDDGSTSLARLLAGWGDDGPPPGLAEAVAAEAEAMEVAGALHLAYTTLQIVRELAGADAPAAGVCLAQQARVAREAGDLDLACDLYDAVGALARARGDTELQARGCVGAGVVALQRGNYPAAADAFRSALRVARDGSPLVSGAHHGLMLVAMTRGRIDEALVHGWSAFRTAGDDADQRADALLNLSSLARRAGRPAAALRAARAAVRLTRLERLRLPALRGVLLAAQELGRHRTVALVITLLERAALVTAHPYEAARVWLDLATVLADRGDVRRAQLFRRRGERLAAAHRYHELAWRAADLGERLPPPRDGRPVDDVAERPRAVADRLRPDDTAASSSTAATPRATHASDDVLGRLATLPLHADVLRAMA